MNPFLGHAALLLGLALSLSLLTQPGCAIPQVSRQPSNGLQESSAEINQLPAPDLFAGNETGPLTPGGEPQEGVSSPPTFTRIDPQLFDGVRDQSATILMDAYFTLLEKARDAPIAQFESQARRDLTLAHLIPSPEQYRGQIIYLRGHLRRLTEHKPAANHAGFEKLYEGWLFTSESQQLPYVIITSRIPAGMPMGPDLMENVSFAGYFLQLWKYKAQDGYRFAPLLLGHRMVWYKSPEHHGAKLAPVLGGIAVALVVTLLAVSLWSRSRLNRLRARYRLRPPASPDDLAGLAGRTE